MYFYGLQNRMSFKFLIKFWNQKCCLNQTSSCEALKDCIYYVLNKKIIIGYASL